MYADGNFHNALWVMILINKSQNAYFEGTDQPEQLHSLITAFIKTHIQFCDMFGVQVT